MPKSIAPATVAPVTIAPTTRKVVVAPVTIAPTTRKVVPAWQNGVGNRFSRMGALLLRTHFDAVWDGSGATQFAAWWQHAEAHSLCYSFECVVPAILGDHGATPSAAYMVLTCVSHTKSGTFLSPAQLLVLATHWRLPLNEVWYVPWERAAAIEEALHAARWTMADSDAQAVLAGSGEHQAFLTHGETQGEVLEGFVMMALDANVEDLAPLIAKYEAAVGGRRKLALLAAMSCGRQCKEREAALLAQLDTPSELWPEWPAVLPFEPRRLTTMSTTEVWERVCSSAGGPLGRLFTTLRAMYSHRVSLKAYMYKGVLQIQLEVKDDQIFFGWGLHVALYAVAPLFRGMVVSFDAPLAAVEEEVGQAGQAGIDGALEVAALAEAVPATRVLGIAKLKCLNYLFRTFGIRNQLPCLLKQGPRAYIARTENFFRNWSVPEEHRPRLREVFSRWAIEVHAQHPTVRADLETGSYLRTLEPLLRGEQQLAEADAASGGLSGLERFALVIVNLTGGDLRTDTLPLYAPGMLPLTRKDGAEAARPGTVSMVKRPPGGRALATGEPPMLVLVFPPLADATREWQAKMSACASLASRFPHLRGRVFVRPTVDEWRVALNELVTVLPLPSPPPAAPTETEPAAAAVTSTRASSFSSSSSSAAHAEAQPQPQPLPHRTVVVVVGLPPGGGKSTFFSHLRDGGAVVVSSDEEMARTGDRHAFDVTLQRALSRSPSGLVCYDKNVPNADGLAKLCRVLAACARALKVCISVLPIVPAHLDHDAAWQRVLARPPTDVALNVHKAGVDEIYRIFAGIFFEPSRAFLPHAQALPGAIVTSAFWRGVDATSELAELTLRSTSQAAPLPILRAALDELDEAGGVPPPHAQGHAWVCATIPGTKLHVTLVPPPAAAARGSSSPAAEAEARRKVALGRLRGVLGSWVRVGLVRYICARSTSGQRQLGFWEVDGISGLADEAQHAVQKEIYHVTDLAALVNCSPRDAAELLTALRQVARGPPGAVASVADDEAQRRVCHQGVEWLISEPLPLVQPETAAVMVDALVQLMS